MLCLCLYVFVCVCLMLHRTITNVAVMKSESGSQPVGRLARQGNTKPMAAFVRIVNNIVFVVGATVAPVKLSLLVGSPGILSCSVQ